MTDKLTIESSFAYSLTVPGELPYSSQNYRAGLGITEEVEADSLEGAVELASQRIAQIAVDAKLQVINEAGLSAVTDANGVIQPVFGQVEETTNVRAIQSAPSAPVASAPAETNSAPASGPMWDGRPIRIFDNRESKKSEKSPDLRIQFLDVDASASDDDKFKAFWLTNRDGSQNTAALKVLSMLGS